MASGSVPFAKALVASAGLNPGSEVKLLAVGVGAPAALALQQKRVDALGIWDTMQASLENRGLQFPRITAPFVQDIIGQVIAARDEYLAENGNVAAGFALYLNRRTLLEGWDIEVALRKITQRHAAAAVLVVCCMFPLVCFAAERNAQQEIAEVLKAPEFPHEIEAMRWQRRHPLEPDERRAGDQDGAGGLAAFAQGLAAVARVLFWVAAAALLAYALWWLARMLPRGREPLGDAYRPPASLFGMDIAPDKLPADVGAAAAQLARAGRLREALSLLYRGSLSDLVHRRGVELLASHTELEALELARKRLDPDRSAYLQTLVRTWRECAYSRRAPGGAEVEHLAAGFGVMAAP